MNIHLAYSIYCHRLTTKLCIILQKQITNHTFFYSPLFGSLCRSSLFPRQEKRVPKTYALLTTAPHRILLFERLSLLSFTADKRAWNWVCTEQGWGYQLVPSLTYIHMSLKVKNKWYLILIFPIILLECQRYWIFHLVYNWFHIQLEPQNRSISTIKVKTKP